MGIYLITVFIFFLAITISLELGVFLMDQYIDSYYIFVSYVLLIPLYVACILYFCYGGTKSQKDRGNLITGVVLAGISVFLYEFYSVIYFKEKYEYDEVKIGAGPRENPNNYTLTYSKDAFAIRFMVELIIYESLLIYFLYVACKWKDLTNRK